MYIRITALIVGVALGPMVSSSFGQVPQAGMQVHVDPATGKLIDPPPSAPQPAAAAKARRALPAPRKGTSPAGGTEILLDDRFTASMEVTDGADGKPAIGCHDGSRGAR